MWKAKGTGSGGVTLVFIDTRSAAVAEAALVTNSNSTCENLRIAGCKHVLLLLLMANIFKDSFIRRRERRFTWCSGGRCILPDVLHACCYVSIPLVTIHCVIPCVRSYCCSERLLSGDNSFGPGAKDPHIWPVKESKSRSEMDSVCTTLFTLFLLCGLRLRILLTTAVLQQWISTDRRSLFLWRSRSRRLLA